MVCTGQAAHWIRYLNEDFILILSSSSPITNKPGCSHMLSYSLMRVTCVVCHIFCAQTRARCRTMDNVHVLFCQCAFMHECSIYIGEALSKLGTTLVPLLPNNLLYFNMNTFAVLTTLLYLCTITDSNMVFQEHLFLWCTEKNRPKFCFQW